MRQKLPTPFGLRQAAEEAKRSILEEAAAHVRQVFQAAELDPELVTPLETDHDFAIFVSGSERPDWSRREAGRLARGQVAWRAHLERMNATAAKMEQGRVVSMPKWHGVLLCPACNELQIGSSRSSRGTHECQTCPTRCKEVHRANQRSCPSCKVQMEVIWTTDEEIPEDWKT